MTSALTVTDADGRPIQTVGRRKEAIVRVRLLPGTGQFKLNGRTMDDYFPNKVHQQLIREPFVILEKGEQYDVVGLLHGGGVSGQAGALRLAIARALTGSKRDSKVAYRHSGYPGGLRTINVGEELKTRPDRVIERAVKGMLPHNTLGRQMVSKLKVYAGPEHPHAAQQPQTYEIKQVAQ